MAARVVAVLLTANGAVGCGARSDLTVPMEVGDAAVDVAVDVLPPPLCPRRVLTTSSTPTTFSVDATFVYYADRILGGIARVATSGGAAELIASETRTVLNVSVDDAFVYWSAGSESDTVMYKAAKAPSSAPTTLRTTPNGSPASFAYPYSFLLAVDDRFVAWEQQGILHWLDKGNPIYGWRSSVYQHTPYDRTSRGVVSDGGYAYWATGTVLQRARLGSSDTDGELLLAVTEDRIRGFGIDDTNVYWLVSNGWDHDVSRAAKDGTHPEPFVRHARDAAIALDADAIYVTTDAGLVAISKTTRAMTVIEPGVVAQAIAVDADCVYFLARSQSDVTSIVRTPKR